MEIRNSRKCNSNRSNFILHKTTTIQYCQLLSHSILLLINFNVNNGTHIMMSVSLNFIFIYFLYSWEKNLKGFVPLLVIFIFSILVQLNSFFNFPFQLLLLLLLRHIFDKKNKNKRESNNKSSYNSSLICWFYGKHVCISEFKSVNSSWYYTHTSHSLLPDQDSIDRNYFLICSQC